MRNKTIDFAKFIAAIMIVAIHTSLFSDGNDMLCFVTLQVICRLAVPFFAICTGYFLSERMTFGKTLEKTDRNFATFLRHWKKLFWLYAVWTVVYLFHAIPIWIEIGWFSPFAFVDYAVGAVTKGSHYHFWYLWGMIYTLPAFYLLLRIINRRYLLELVAAMWIIKAVSYGHVSYLPSCVLKPLQSAETFLCLLPLLLTGTIIAGERTKKTRLDGAGFAFCAIALTAEAFGRKSVGQEAVSYGFFTLPTAYFLFRILLHSNIKFSVDKCKKLGTASVFVYCVHPILVETLEKKIRSGTLLFLAVAAGSIVLSFAYIKIKEIIVRKKGELCST